MKSITTPHKIHILGVPMALGQGRRGVDMGPSAVRYARLQDRLAGLGYEIFDMGNVLVPTAEEVAESELASPYQGGAHHLNKIVEVCQSIYEAVSSYRNNYDFTIVLGGDHSMSLGSVAGVLQTTPSLHAILLDPPPHYNT